MSALKTRGVVRQPVWYRDVMSSLDRGDFFAYKEEMV